MWPWGHLAVGYLLYVALARGRGVSPRVPAVLAAVAFGTQLPDLIDKPLAWTFGLLPAGRSLGHSLLTAVILIALAAGLAAAIDRRELAVGFGVGLVSHQLGDLGPEVVGGLLLGDLSQLRWTTYLLWPVLESPPYPTEESFAAHFALLAPDAFTLAQVALFGLAVAVWLRDGAPGVDAVRKAAARLHGSVSGH